MRAYMVYDRHLGSHEGACLVFANSTKDAKQLGHPFVMNWFDSEWIDIGVSWLKNKDWIFNEAISDKPHVIESPRTCDICLVWGNEFETDTNICVDCMETCHE